ncbi:histidine kinase N-terminal domain-containing protein [Alkalihalobacillus macyae]|uniref:histidine kinase N-terminal domain-containing protein n=1 Tax=Guptibacillus hwajinpoensis TaxID=208199 RepID=UPI00273C63AA|nr:histidine kinase N-terminal domain-containing protein [Alkalihalobacillus macyae]MDP4550746.1 histidine kinase N-terminal domain-containing protein [Alkalihalobacillus macyae]
MSNDRVDNQLKEHLAVFLESSQPIILDKWLAIVRLSPDDPYYNEVIKNGKRTVELISRYIRNPDENWIQKLTKKIAKERINANVNIGEFVANINSGRSVVISVLKESSFDRKELSTALEIINNYFNAYLYHSVTEYTKLKDSIIQDKNKFIQEMHSDRLTILGQLGASFAHEFRNPLTSIKGFLKLLEDDYDESNKVRKHYFEILNGEMKNLEEKVSQFLFLSKMRAIDDKPLSINLSGLLRYTIEIVYPRLLESKIEVETSIEPDIPLFGVEEQIKQVILNIMINSIEELSDSRPKNRKIIMKAKENLGRIVIEITNNGRQIPSHIVESIFEPFISTKKLGTGLGLSVCKQIIEKHEGVISVRTNRKETTFVIELPIMVDKGVKEA